MTDLLCSFCHKPIGIETAKTNEFGKAIHEACYVLKMQGATQLRRMRILAWVSTVPATATCSACGELFTVPVKQLTTVMASVSLQRRFEEHTCKATTS
jgi:hypothetical protein